MDHDLFDHFLSILRVFGSNIPNLAGKTMDSSSSFSGAAWLLFKFGPHLDPNVWTFFNRISFHGDFFGQFFWLVFRAEVFPGTSQGSHKSLKWKNAKLRIVTHGKQPAAICEQQAVPGEYDPPWGFNQLISDS